MRLTTDVTPDESSVKLRSERNLRKRPIASFSCRCPAIHAAEFVHRTRKNDHEADTSHGSLGRQIGVCHSSSACLLTNFDEGRIAFADNSLTGSVGWSSDPMEVENRARG